MITHPSYKPVEVYCGHCGQVFRAEEFDAESMDRIKNRSLHRYWTKERAMLDKAEALFAAHPAAEGALRELGRGRIAATSVDQIRSWTGDDSEFADWLLQGSFSIEARRAAAAQMIAEFATEKPIVCRRCGQGELLLTDQALEQVLEKL